MVQQSSRLDTSALVRQMIADIQADSIGNSQQKLASEPELMVRYGVTRYTLRQALARLESLGFAYQAQGIGTFIRARKDSHSITIQNKINLTEELSQPYHALVTMAAQERYLLPKQAEFLPISFDLPASTRLLEIKRWRTLGGSPYVLECSYYLADIVGSIPKSALRGSLLTFLSQDSDIRPAFIDETISADALTENEADFFHTDAGTPALVLRDDAYLNSGQLLAFSRLKYNCEKTQLFMFKKLN